MNLFIALILFLPLRVFSSEEIQIKGTLLIEGRSALYQLQKISEDQYQLKITPKNSQNSCLYQVKKITSPQQTKGRDGIISSNKPNDCTFEIAENNDLKFWNDIELLDIYYRFDKSMQLEGKAILNSIQKTYYGEAKFIVE